jgi:hypothetical protein
MLDTNSLYILILKWPSIDGHFFYKQRPSKWIQTTINCQMVAVSNIYSDCI